MHTLMWRRAAGYTFFASGICLLPGLFSDVKEVEAYKRNKHINFVVSKST